MEFTTTIADELAVPLHDHLLTIPGDEYTDGEGNRVRPKQKYPTGLAGWLSEQMAGRVADAASALAIKPVAVKALDDQIAALHAQKEQLARGGTTVQAKA